MKILNVFAKISGTLPVGLLEREVVRPYLLRPWCEKVYQCLCDRRLTPNEDKSIYMAFSINKMFLNFNSTIHKWK